MRKSPIAAVALVWAAACLGAPPGAKVQFDRDIRPILSDRCYICHGPDEVKRTSKLRLDTQVGAKADLGGRFGIVPGDASKSEVIRRITTQDRARRMPPAWSGADKLSDREIDLITRWVAEGAEWQKHWSFLAPVRPALPKVVDTSWPRNQIDYFVLARLEREGFKPSPQADRRTLIRRVALDITGIPPTPREIEAFVNDSSRNAYEKVVDRLLSSSRYGERMAVRWLDAARYADTNGYQTDGERSMWRWRDWVIDAFNRNMPFDRFTVEQIAGDMLPQASLQQIIATGFNRNHRGNGEGGIIPEEYAVEYVVDRVETTSTVWLGLTLGCARCHNHKYDPLTQKEFYQVFAYFNNVPERGKASKHGNSPPLIHAPTTDQAARLEALEKKLAASERQMQKLELEIAKAQTAWIPSASLTNDLNWALSRSLAVHLPFDGSETHVNPVISGQDTTLAVGESSASGAVASAWKDGLPRYEGGQVGPAADFDGKRYVEVGDVANFGFYDSFTLAAWINPSATDGVILSRANDEPEGKGFALSLKDGHLQGSMVQRWLDDGARVESEVKVEVGKWSHVALTYDGSRLAENIRIYLNGEPLKLKIHLDDLNESFATRNPLRIGGGMGPSNRFRGLIDDVRIYRTALTRDEAAVLAVRETVTQLAGMARNTLTTAQSAKLRWCFLDEFAPKPFRNLNKQLLDLRDERDRHVQSLPTVMVMRERTEPRATHLLIRGAYDRPGEKVSPGPPAALPLLPREAPNNRLGFAKWLVDRSNPLTARVAVNRYWQLYFGAGLVKTVEDFGSQGDPPSNPELLDWLATEFIRTGWDVKAIQKAIVMSATYRQSSRMTPELLQRDPENRLLARGPRVRLSADVVRDQALAVSGLLVEKIGGPSVKPYQPAGLWRELAGGADYRPDKGEGLHRRSLYTFWKRTAPPPMMMNFDAGGRETCVVREHRTNTPLQSLNLMNDVTFLEAARALAQRMMKEGGRTAVERIGYGFELATSRRPKPREDEVLLSSLSHYRAMFQSDPAAALKYLNQGEAPRDETLDVSELAAYSTVASLILNLDVTVTKE